MDTLSILYTHWSGRPPVSIIPLPPAGSNRHYFRLTGPGGSCIGVQGTSVEENRTFLYLARHFSGKALPMPQIYIASSPEITPDVAPDEYYLQEDLGTHSLFDALEAGRNRGGVYSPGEKELLHKTIALLPALQYEGAERLDFDQCYPQKEFDRATVLFDLNYFKYCFLKLTGLEFDEVCLEKEFQQMAADLTAERSTTFLYRDFQARNVMLKDGEPYFIDFQGGRKGPVYYDVASFLWQAKACYPETLREELIDTYLHHLARYTPVDASLFRERLRHFVLLRSLQVLGAYGYRGYFERKPHFLQSIPPAIKNLSVLLDKETASPYPYLVSLLMEMCGLPQFKPCCREAQDELVIRIFSFSYKKGIPEDTSGNGGGYVFDCRSTHNPGRYEPYKQLTGLDEPVIRFLEEDGEILTFLESVYRLADTHVARYLERGFTDLMFSFGCTGGQHRSVYSAQHLAEYLSERYGVKVCLVHREQGIHSTFTARKKNDPQ